MKIFQTIRMNLDAIGYRANDNTLNKNHVWALLISSSVIVAQFEYICYEATGIEEYTLCFFMITTGIGIFISFLSTILRKRELNDLFDNVQAVIDKISKTPVLKAKCDEINEFVDKLSEIIDFFMSKVPLFGLLKASVCLFVYFTTDSGPDAFKLPIPLWFPFDWRKPFGYSMAVAIQIFMLAYPVRYLACFAAIALGAYLFTIAFVKCVQDDIKSINDDLKSKIDISEKLPKLINLHADVKHLTAGFSELYATTITTLFTASTIAISIALLMIQVQISRDNINSEFFLESICCVFWAFVLVFFANEIGQRFSDIFKRIEYEIGQINWYLYPMKLQRFVPIYLVNIQQPIAIQFFGSAVCGREQFKKVISTGYSYFMVLHKIY